MQLACTVRRRRGSGAAERVMAGYNRVFAFRFVRGTVPDHHRFAGLKFQTWSVHHLVLVTAQFSHSSLYTSMSKGEGSLGLESYQSTLGVPFHRCPMGPMAIQSPSRIE